MPTETKVETNLQRHGRENAEGAARQRAARSPGERELADALKITKQEQDDLAAAEARLAEAGLEMDRIGAEIQRLRADQAPTKQQYTSKSGRSFFREIVDAKAQAAAAAALPGLGQDLEAARQLLTLARRKRNAVAHANAQAAQARRRAVKAKLGMTTPAPVKSRSDSWASRAAAVVFGVSGE